MLRCSRRHFAGVLEAPCFESFSVQLGRVQGWWQGLPSVPERPATASCRQSGPVLAARRVGAQLKCYSGVVAGKDTPLPKDQIPSKVLKDYTEPGGVEQAPAPDEDEDAGSKMFRERQEREASEEGDRELAREGGSGHIGYGYGTRTTQKDAKEDPIPPEVDIYSGGYPPAGDAASSQKDREGARDKKGG